MLQKLILLSLFLATTTLSYAQIDPDIFSKYESKYILIDGYKINIEVKGEGAPIFFLPGGPGNSHDYMQGNFGQYYKTNTLVFFDWLGRGHSDNAKDVSEYSVIADVDMIEKIRVHLGMDKISLVGHSYGTVPAQGYALKYPQHIDRMLLISGFHSGAMWQANCDSYNRYTKTHFPLQWDVIDSLRMAGHVSTDPEFQKIYWSLPTKYIYYHNTRLKQNVPKKKYRGWSMDVYNEIIGRDGDFHVGGSMIETDYRRKLKDVNAKTLIVAGRYDGVSTPEWNVQYLKFMPQAEFIMFEKSGHNPYLEESDLFFEHFERFFNIENKD